MADAPEVVSHSLHGENLPELVEKGDSDGLLEQQHGVEKEAGGSVDENTNPKFAMGNDAQAISKLGTSIDEKRIDPSRNLEPDAPAYEEANPSAHQTFQSEDDWHHGFWDCFTSFGLCMSKLDTVPGI